MKMRYITIIIVIACLACKNRVQLEKQTPAVGIPLFEVTLSPPAGTYKTWENRVDQLLKKNYSVTLNNSEFRGYDKQSFAGWLQDQLEGTAECPGIMHKIVSKNPIDRRSDEFYIYNETSGAYDKASIVVSTHFDSIPEQWLNQSIWEQEINIPENKLNISQANGAYNAGGLVIRKENGIKDTLYGYQYPLELEFAIQYYNLKKNETKTTQFKECTNAIIYHQLKI